MCVCVCVCVCVYVRRNRKLVGSFTECTKHDVHHLGIYLYVCIYVYIYICVCVCVCVCVLVKLNPGLPWQKKKSFYQQIGLKFEEETSEMLRLEHGNIRC